MGLSVVHPTVGSCHFCRYEKRRNSVMRVFMRASSTSPLSPRPSVLSTMKRPSKTAFWHAQLILSTISSPALSTCQKNILQSLKWSSSLPSTSSRPVFPSAPFAFVPFRGESTLSFRSHQRRIAYSSNIGAMSTSKDEATFNKKKELVVDPFCFRQFSEKEESRSYSGTVLCVSWIAFDICMKSFPASA